MVGSELYSTKVKETGTAIGMLICSSQFPGTHFQAGLRIKEIKEVYQGELTELTLTGTKNPLSGYGKTVLLVLSASKL